ncbi:helix-turn-helix domain-containing protein [Methylobacterium oryzihabitans]|uniref:Helix-turn-helix domain-containing protein n=1 Tax=Methylobacterium oryzihabitans TaxID=2499852 RepID=A0A3S2VU16_9HYPH|nr:helix-turn-helix domain-containing protein [Methylobacterium oryzihabitans]RVU17472.1 helix-turn-helix domain-containing protein [Methylobacterium oryzihabitans]
MSVQAIAYVISQRIEDAGAKLVAMVLANYVDARTGLAFPTIRALAEDASQSERTVQRKLRDLAELGLITIRKGMCPRTGRQRANHYLLHLPGLAPPRGDSAGEPAGPEPARGDSLTPHDPDEGCQPDTGEGDSVVTPGGDTAVTPLKGTVIGTVRQAPPQPPDPGGLAHGPAEVSGKDPPEPEPGTVAARFDRLLAAYPARGSAWANRQAARTLFAALTPAEQFQAIAAAAAYAAHCTANPGGTPKYLHSWLRNGVFRNHAPGPVAAGGATPRSVFVPAGSAGWEAWRDHLRRQGRPVPAPMRSDAARTEGWWFPTALPPEARP